MLSFRRSYNSNQVGRLQTRSRSSVFSTCVFIATFLMLACAGLMLACAGEALAAGPISGGTAAGGTLVSIQPRQAHKVAGAKKVRVAKAHNVKHVATVKYVARGNAVQLTKAGRTAISLRGKRVSKRTMQRLQRVSAGPDVDLGTILDGTRTNRPKIAEIPAITLTPGGFPSGTSLQTLVDGADFGGKVHDTAGKTIALTIDSSFQQTAETLLARYAVPWGSIVAMDPHTGAIRAIASYSGSEPNGPEVATRGGFPAASLFKIITTATAVERAGMGGDDLVAFRGGNYTLSMANYDPDQARDRRLMTLAEALGRSCNPVFARVALNNFTPIMLKTYAEKFGFNRELGFDTPIALSRFTLPTDHYDFARTAAGFGDVTVTPIHAAAIVSALANNGVMMRPYIISQVSGADGKPLYNARGIALHNVVRPDSARTILDMMQSTVEIGTARRQFSRSTILNNIPVAAKTGTLSGESPKGVYHWFVAAIPADAPELVISVLVINPGSSRANAVQIGRQFLERSYVAKDKPIESTREKLPEDTNPADGVS